MPFVRSWLLIAKVISRREHYPAPYAILELWRKYDGDPFRATRDPDASVEALFAHPTTANLIRIFFLQERLKGLGKGAPEFKPRHVHVVGDLPANRALPGNHKRVVVGSHQSGATLPGDVAGDGYAILAVTVVEHDLSAIAFRALSLGERRIGRHYDGSLHVQDVRRSSHALRMIAGRERDHAASAGGLRDRGELVERASEFKRSGPLQHFRFQENARSNAFVKARRGQKRRPHREWRKHARGRVNIGGAHGEN